MQPVSFKRHMFPPDVIRLTVWLYFRFTLSFRDVEEMLAQRGIEAGYETIRLWRAVDDEGEVLDMLVQKRRNTTAALRLLRKLLKHQGILPEVIVTDAPLLPLCGSRTWLRTSSPTRPHACK